MPARRGRKLRFILITATVIALVAVVALLVMRRPERAAREQKATEAPPAPPDLAKYRADFSAGVEALARGDGAEAVRHFERIEFGARAVEEYRLYYLANALQLAGEAAAARRTLASLWRRSPKLVYRNDVAFNIASLYAEAGSWSEAAEVYGTLAAREENAAVAGEARWSYIEARLYGGDPAAALFAAKNLLIENPDSPRAAEAIAVTRALLSLPATAALPLTGEERLERAENLLRDKNASAVLSELAAFNADALNPPYRQRVLLARGLALQQLRRWADSEKTLAPLLTDQFRFAIPATRASARNNAVLGAAINPVSYKTVKEKKRVGTVKVRTKRKKYVRRPKYRTTTRSVKVINLQLKLKKDDYERTASERLRDLLEMPLPTQLRKETLTALLARAEEKNQDAYVRELVTHLVKIDPDADPGLQRFWDKAWGAYSRNDLKTARELLSFIRDTYRSPNVRRQAIYWLARIDGRTGNDEAAARAYQQLVDSEYEDLYARFARARGGKPSKRERITLEDAPDWNEVAEKGMPAELRLAWELLSLDTLRDARIELQENTNDRNRKWADALLGQLFHRLGNFHAAYRFMRRAYPELATSEQTEVPRQFIRMYYPLDHKEKIVTEAKRHGLDPYLVMALIRQESAYDPRARSPVGATGLMQIMPATGRELARRLGKGYSDAKLNDPQYNIELGTLYLKQLINRFRSTELALAAYNGGMGNVWKWQAAFRGKAPDEFIESIPFSETRGYVKRITMMRSTYEELHEELD